MTDFRGDRHRRCRRLALLVLALALAAAGCRDDDAKAKSDAVPRRIVTLTPSSTELVAALGAADRLVGVDRYSDTPPSVKDLPVVGDFLSPNVEAIVRLRPDLVVLDEVQARIAPALRAAGIRAVVLPMHTIRDLRAGLVAIGEALGEPAAGWAAAERLDAALAAVQARAAARAKRGDERPRVLAIVDREPTGLRGLVAAGPGSYLDELLARIGAENALAAAGVRYPKISADQILRDPPDVILDTSRGDLDAWNGLTEVPAVAAGRVHALRERHFQSPSPRLAEALAELERLVHDSNSSF